MGLFTGFWKKDKNRGSNSDTTRTTEGINNANNQELVDDKSNELVTLQEIALLYFAPRYTIDEKEFPEYLRTTYRIGFPREMLQRLYKTGFLRYSNTKESLEKIKASELKDIAQKMGIKSSQKKDELLNNLMQNVDESRLIPYIKVRYWVLTNEGEELINNHPYIKYYLEPHPYSLKEIGIDFNTFCKVAGNKRYRDSIWSELNRLLIEKYRAGIEKHNFQEYCQVLRTQALFLQEESKYLDALAIYARYLYYNCNYDAGLKAILFYNILKKSTEMEEQLYINAELLPFQVKELTSLCSDCDLTSQDLKVFLIKCFNKEKDSGLFTEEELSNFIMCELNGEKEQSKAICKNTAQRAIRTLTKMNKK